MSENTLSEAESLSLGENYPANHLKLLSGCLFKIYQYYAYVSCDSGATWEKRGNVNPYPPNLSLMLFDDISIQIQKGERRGRIISPHYLEMDGDHPDYTREEYGGHAIWKGKRRLIETHTYVPEMAGSYMMYSDDEGRTWNSSKGFLMGYLNDGYLGLWSCEEPVIAELKSGVLICLMRSTTGRLLKSYSMDAGLYWSKVCATDIACSNSPAMVQTIPVTGDLVLVWNQVSADEIRRGYRRGRLSMAISMDDGETWINHRTLELVTGLDGDEKISAGPLEAMVRGPVDKGMIPDDYFYYDYPNICFNEDNIVISYRVGTIEGESFIKSREFPVSQLYR
jgi:hypothetical protein